MTGTDERTAWIALASVPGVGGVSFGRLLEHFGSAAAALEAAAAQRPGRVDAWLRSTSGTRTRAGVGRALQRAAADPGVTQRAVEALGGWVLVPGDREYPSRLHEIEEPPLVLYGSGSATALSEERLVAVVGTRRPTAFGRDLAGRIVRRLVEAGVTVASGLAVGIDGAAHRATLEADGLTIAVIGSGLDAPGPAAHRSLAERISERGTVVGELAPGVSATQGTFPRRNRIISGLARATIVVEAPVRSGALITARHALEQGRIVSVAPGRPFDRRVAGNLALLRETPALPLVGLDEMLVDLGLDRHDMLDEAEAPAQLSLRAALELLGPNERAVASALGGGPRSVDALCMTAELDPGAVSAALTILQLRGWVRVLGGTYLPAGPLLEQGPGV